MRGNHFRGTLAGHRATSQLIHSTRRGPCPLSPACRSCCRLQSFHRCYHSEANAERALGGRSLPPNVDIQTRPKTHEHTPNDSQRPTDIPPVTVTVTLSREVGMIIVVTIVHTSVPSAAALSSETRHLGSPHRQAEARDRASTRVPRHASASRPAAAAAPRRSPPKCRRAGACAERSC